jgi:hypothetical protein
MWRYWRAFWIALRMTLRGERIPAPVQTPLQGWMDETGLRLEAISRAAEQESVDPSQVRLHIDRREISMATILQSVAFNRQEAFPRLLRERGGQPMNYIYASNMGDHFRVSRLEAALPPDSKLQQAVAALAEHLESVPQSDNS